MIDVLVLWWIAVGLLGWMYAGYPLIMALVSRGKKPVVPEPTMWPTVSLMIMTYNESLVIERKIRNSLELHYPAGQLDIMVVDSASTDGTPEIAARFADRGVRLVQQGMRAGKASAINAGLLAARGEIIIVSDANAMMDPEALRFAVRHFSDPRVGGLTGAMRQRDTSGTAESQSGDLYWRYESMMRVGESRLHSVIAMSGEMSVYRRSMFVRDGQVVPWYTKGATDDFEQTLYIIAHGQRVVYEPAAVVWEPAPDNAADLASQKIRIITQTIVSVRQNMWKLFRSGWYGWFIFPTRKVLPLASPWLLLWVLCATWILATQNSAWAILGALQTLIYVVWGLGRTIRPLARLLGPVDFLLTLNMFVLVSWIRLWRGHDFTVWNKVESSRTALS